MRVGMGMTRDEELAYARERGIDVPSGPSSPFSIDANLWGRSIEAGVLEDPWTPPPADAFAWTVDPADAPREAREVVIGFEQGVPVSLDGEAARRRRAGRAAQHTAGGAHGIGRIDHVEDRLIGIKSREIYEAPAAVVLHAAHAALEQLTLSRELLAYKRSVGDRLATLAYDGLWFSELGVALRAFVTHTQRYVSGEVRMRFTPGSAAVIGRRSPHSLYDIGLATYDAGDRFDHESAVGFIAIWGLPGAHPGGRARRRRQRAAHPPRRARRRPAGRRGAGGSGPMTGEKSTRGLRMAGTIAALTSDSSYVRRARTGDVDRILEVIGTYVSQRVLLPRTREEILDDIGSWWVGDLNGEVVGCAALRDFGGGLAELRSLSVVASAHGRGLGESLVHAVVREARKRAITRLFAITRNPGYFARHGFAELAMDDVPDVLHADRVPWPARSGAGHAMALEL